MPLPQQVSEPRFPSGRRAVVCVSPPSDPPKTSSSFGTCELEIHISVTRQERGIEVQSWGMKWHPQTSLGAACITRTQLSPRSTLGFGSWDSPTTHRQQDLYNLWKMMGESQCPRAGTQPEGQAQCCHPYPNAALAICSVLLTAPPFDHTEET